MGRTIGNDTVSSARAYRSRRRPHRRYRRRRRGIFRWRWGKRTKKIGKRKYRMRVLFKRVGRRWMRTKRAYWRRYGRRNRRRRRYRRRYRNRKYRWFWSGRTKKTKRGLYRRRVLYKRVGRKWVKTKRVYWRRVRKAKKCFWRWDRLIKKVRGALYRRRHLVCRRGRRWVTRRIYWKRIGRIHRRHRRYKPRRV